MRGTRVRGLLGACDSTALSTRKDAGVSVLRDYATAVTKPALPFAVAGLPASRFDEVVDADGSLRPAWLAVAHRTLELTPREITRLQGEITRFLADDGVSHVRGDADPMPWQLDPLPLVLDSAAWSPLAVGLAQRAELLSAIHTDLYGPQRLLSEGIIPSAAVYAHSGFTRALARSSADHRHTLLLTATDLGRGADGEWTVLGDRTQSPAGLGYAAENRRVLSHVLPDLHDDESLHRIEPYLSALHASLLASAPQHPGEAPRPPRIVIMTPGATSEASFDQAFLAGALGYPLLEGSDLVVNDGRVWMKPAGWPHTRPSELIDVILRRVDGDASDPLEMRSASGMGVAGLADVVRRGGVSVVNGLGSGVLENPALLPFLPAASQLLLGEQLRLPSVPTWWCGAADSREHVLERLRQNDPTLLIRPIDQPRSALDGLDADAIAARIRSAPHRYVGQDLLPLSQTPTWSPGHPAAASARPVTLRTFTLRFGSSYRPLVGGLATVRTSIDAAPVAKDVWVIKSPDEADQGMAEIDSAPSARTIPPLPPRALGRMLRTGRFSERTEDILRLVLVAQRHLDQPRAASAAGTASGAAVLLRTLDRHSEGNGSSPDTQLRNSLLDASHSGSAAWCISQLRVTMTGVRDQLSSDVWRVFAHIDRATRALRSSDHTARTSESAGRMLTAILSLQGVTSNMIRDAGWHMIEVGRFIQRGMQLCELLQAGATERRGARDDRETLEAVLTASESIVTYRRRYRGAVLVGDVLDLLLRDGANPRSLGFALLTVREHVAALPASTGSTRPERLLDDLISLVEAIDLPTLTVVEGGRRAALSELLTHVSDQLVTLTEAIEVVHVESGPPPVALTSLALIEEHMEARA